MIRDEQEIRDYLEALELMYTKAGLSGHEVSLTDPRITVLRWVLKRDSIPSIIEDIITEYRQTEQTNFGLKLMT